MTQKGVDRPSSEFDRLIANRIRWSRPTEPQEIRSGAICPDPDSPGRFVIDANTARGSRKFRQVEEIGSGDPQSEEGFATTDARENWFAQLDPSETIHDYLVFCLKRSSRGLGHWVRVGATQQRPQRSEIEWQENELTPAALLSTIASQNASHEERRRAIIEAEVVAFSPDQVAALNSLLRDFIEQYRNSDEQRDLVAVAAAIRKFVATMNRSDFSALAILLDAEHNATVPIDVELEVAKTLVRRLVQSPPDEPNTEPQLADRLYEIVETYLNPRLLSRDKVAAVTLNAILALCLLRSPYTADVRQSLNGLRVSWFSELVARRAVQVRNMVHEKVASDLADNYTEQLTALVEELVSSGT